MKKFPLLLIALVERLPTLCRNYDNQVSLHVRSRWFTQRRNPAICGVKCIFETAISANYDNQVSLLAKSP